MNPSLSRKKFSLYGESVKVYKSIVSHTMHCIKITLTLNCTAAVSVYLHEECCSSLEAALHLDESSVCRSCRQMHPSCRSLHLSAPQLQVAAGLHAAVGGCQESDDWDLGDLRLDSECRECDGGG